MRRTFNLGVGLCVVVEASVADSAINTLQSAGEIAWRLGTVVRLAPHTAFEDRVLFD
jgi:phosphoribosylformylglycinamidine cyclo-ligase